MKKLLLVTFPVDLGNTTYEKRFINLFEYHPDIDLKVFRFAPSPQNPHPKSIFTIDYARLFLTRLRESFKLHAAVNEARQEQREVLFHGISPALYGYLASKYNQSYIVTDWTRKLFEPIWQSSGSPRWITWLHKKVLNSQKSVLGLTDAVVEQLAEDYELPAGKLKKARLPFCFDLNLFSPSPIRNDDEVRILFVGGDFLRKGGDVLLQWFRANYEPKLKLTMLTNYPVEELAGVTVERDIQYGQLDHIELFRSHDLFVLPTKCEGYPSVLGEAACAGIAVLTTKYALGAPEVVRDGETGFICGSQSELLEKLTLLVQEKSLINKMKQNSRRLMEEEFSYEVVSREYLQHIFGQP